MMPSSHSGLMLAARITLAYLSVYSMMNLPNLSREVGNGASKLVNPLSNFGIGERAIDLFVEPFDDVSGRILGRSEALQLGWYRRMTCRMVRMLAPMPPWQVSLRSCGLGSLG